MSDALTIAPALAESAVNPTPGVVSESAPASAESAPAATLAQVQADLHALQQRNSDLLETIGRQSDEVREARRIQAARTAQETMPQVIRYPEDPFDPQAMAAYIDAVAEQKAFKAAQQYAAATKQQTIPHVISQWEGKNKDLLSRNPDLKPMVLSYAIQLEATGIPSDMALEQASQKYREMLKVPVPPASAPFTPSSGSAPSGPVVLPTPVGDYQSERLESRPRFTT